MTMQNKISRNLFCFFWCFHHSNVGSKDVRVSAW